MRLMPLAMPASLKILNPPISAVLDTCVPPHNSMEMPGTSTTRTTSPIFSKHHRRPFSLAAAMGISSAVSAALCAIQPLTKFSTSSSCVSVGALGQLKSNLRRSNPRATRLARRRRRAPFERRL